MSEQSEEPELQKSETEKGVIVPNEIAHAFGRGLRQLLEEPMTEIGNDIASLKPFSGVIEELKIEDIASMEEALKQFTDTIDQLEHARVVKIVPLSRGYDFDFSKDRERGEEIEEGTLIMDEDLTLKFVSALSHNLGHSFAIITGTSSMIARYSENEDAKQKAEELDLSSTRIYRDFLAPLEHPKPPNNVSQFKITTNDKGDTTITPISKPKIPSSL